MAAGNLAFASRRDLIAGVSVAGLMLPEAVAYAGIAGLAPGRALAAAVAGSIAYALVGHSRLAVIAPTSAAAALLAAALASLPPGSGDRDAVVTLIVAIVGLLFVIGALVRAGAVASFVARPVLRGFAFGLALTIIVKQLPALLGMTVAARTVPTIIVALVGALGTGLGSAHPASIATGLSALAALLMLRRNPGLPATPLVLVAAIGASMALGLGPLGVPLVGPIVPQLGWPSVVVPPPAELSRLFQLALPIALVIFAESWGTMRSLALARGDTLSPGRELAALGVANLAAALVRGMPVGAGFSAANANAAMGAETRASSVIAALVLAVLVAGAGPYIALLPEPVLAAIVIAALTHALKLSPFTRLFRLDRDQWIAISAAGGVLLLGVLDGMLIAVALAIVALLRRITATRVADLGQVGTHDFVDIATHPDARTVPGIRVLRPDAPLFFGNADMVVALVAAPTLPAVATVILSLEQSDDLDSSAAEALGELAQTLATRGAALRLARVHDRARAVLDAAGLAALYDPAAFSVADAVASATKGG